MNNIIFFGPPGAGKGTQAKIISDLLNLPHLSTGEILRSKITQNDKLGIELKNIMSSGKLVSDDILNKIVSEKLINCEEGFILDGYPRTLEQALYLNTFLKESYLKLNFIFNIRISFDILKNRILKRSEEDGREDDNLDVLNTRYSTYLKTTQPASEHYQNNKPDIFYDINGDDEIEQITSKIKKILKK